MHECAVLVCLIEKGGVWVSVDSGVADGACPDAVSKAVIGVPPVAEAARFGPRVSVGAAGRVAFQPASWVLAAASLKQGPCEGSVFGLLLVHGAYCLTLLGHVCG